MALPDEITALILDSPFDWERAEEYRQPHARLVRPEGEYLLGQRASDGAWEYATPDEDWGDHEGHILDDLTFEEARHAVEAIIKRRST